MPRSTSRPVPALLPPPDARLGDPALTETSGLTASPAGPGRFWAINDSGNAARVHALNANGDALGSFAVAARNRDWESLSSGVLDGVATLVIGETGDNLRHHEGAALLLVAEPELATAPSGAVDGTPLPVRRLAFVYEDGPRDVEALSLTGGAVWLLDKPPLAADGSRRPSGVYRLEPFERSGSATAGAAPAVARRVGEFLAPSGGLIARLAASVAGVDLGYPTGLELDAQRGHAWVLTYRDVLRYDRVGEEPWERTLARAPARRIAHGLAQAEALALDASGAVVVSSEGRAAPLLAIVPD